MTKLEDKHIFQRLQWALEHKDWTCEEWERVIWSGECIVDKSNSGWQIWVFRQPPEKWLKDCIAPKWKGKGISVMVWGCFWGCNHATFCLLIVRSVNKGVCIKLLEYLLFPVLKHIHDTLGDSIFQQDNAPVYKAAVVMDFFEKYIIQVEDWPSYSPDLNLIEYVWVYIKRRLHRKYPDFRNTNGGPDQVKTRLAEVLPEIWEEIRKAYYDKLSKTMPNRAAAVIDSKGWYRRYWICNSIRFFFSSLRHHYKYLDTL